MMSTDNESPRILRVAETASTNACFVSWSSRNLLRKEVWSLPVARQPGVVRA